MKSPTLALILVGLLAVVSRAYPQCSMMGSSGHKHGSTNVTNRDGHGTHDHTPPSKGYALINDDGEQEATITIKDGYQPDTLVVNKGIPLRLNFDVQEEICTRTVVFNDFMIKKEFLPFAFGSVEFTPDSAGSFTFACPMDMIEGTLIVKE